MATLHWQTEGEGEQDIVLLHGWGLNAQVWNSIIPRLAPHFRLHRADLPGYGQSQGFGPMPLAEMAAEVLKSAPEKAIWLGWSLGGLVASQIALTHPARVTSLVSLCSSPCFQAQETWPGIKPTVLTGFQQQLQDDFQRTVERFLALQTLGTASAKQDARLLKSVVLDQPMPTVDVLNGGLEILSQADLREPLAALTVPFLRIYGALDGLVPRAIVPLLDERWPQSTSVIVPKASHAPFISHPDEVVEALLTFTASR
ncbi:pimeloyl-[acyl-carrier protein] methyl ester esterase [Lonsdalea britannica]|uniref:Pimeloyl-[acyl-carrier protein] methyl ester esterase n=2 Tax=Lonsdalea britannica TaxID=1082704 RepID=A0AAD0SF40_9GAMM|nr:pimeloyl-ACP methyl ester esterase BioH [Lonsdalea britannica]AXW86199.1 pimeloyl-[acyl-carrier protein] methyl ester esterase [Lonsdalea britannica]OSM95309.1 pimeloyl-[acyl-carrier protein] methyl ester esterase [Lonsdalea britannica]OSN04323.1 pimeloyl-[acyl-carrier protein] methyl ester esterase [Lonsdalea britannica]